jgi:hypothetical protein
MALHTTYPRHLTIVRTYTLITLKKASYNYGVRGNPCIVRTYTLIRVSLEGVMTQG